MPVYRELSWELLAHPLTLWPRFWTSQASPFFLLAVERLLEACEVGKSTLVNRICDVPDVIGGITHDEISATRHRMGQGN